MSNMSIVSSSPMKYSDSGLQDPVVSVCVSTLYLVLPLRTTAHHENLL